MAKEKQIQIPESLFYDLAMYFTANDSDDPQFVRCRDGLMAKYNAIQNRQLYTKMHDASLSPADRETARQAYLDTKGVPDSFRWPSDNT